MVLQIAVAVAIALALALPRLRPYRDYRRRCFYRLLSFAPFQTLLSFFIRLIECGQMHLHLLAMQ